MAFLLGKKLEKVFYLPEWSKAIGNRNRFLFLPACRMDAEWEPHFGRRSCAAMTP
jgi:hypothetical protein